MNNEEFEDYKLTDESKNIKKEKPSKHAVLLSTLIILFSIVVVVLYVSTSNTRKNVKYEIPESAEEILPDIALRITNVSDIPKIRFYAYSDDTAAKLYAFVYLINNLDIDYCTFSIYTAEDEFTKLTLEDINNAEEMTDIPLPQEWIDFYNDNNFAEGHVSIHDFVSDEDSDTIEERIDAILSDSGINELQNDEQDNQISVDDENAESETTTEVIDTFSYEYDDSNNLIVSIQQDIETNEIFVVSYGIYENSALMLSDWGQVVVYPMAKSIDVSYISSVGEESYGYVVNNGSIVVNTIQDAVEDVYFPEEYEDRANEMRNQLLEFYAKYGITDKSYNTLVYEDEKVKIYFSGLTEDGVMFSVENMTDTNITIQANSISVNGVSTNDIMMSDDVAPQSTGKVIARCDDFPENTEVATIGGQLRVIDFSESFSSYDATFSNIDVTGNSEQ